MNVDPFAVRVHFNAVPSGRANEWSVELTAEAASAEAAGPLGSLWRGTATLPSSDLTPLRQTAESLRLRTAIDPRGRAVLAVDASGWQLRGPRPDARYVTVFAAPGAALLSVRPIEAATPEAALAAAPTVEVWLRRAMTETSTAAHDAPVHPPVLRGVEIPGGMGGDTGDAFSAYWYAAATGIGVDDALRYSVRGSAPGQIADLDRRLLEQLRSAQPAALEAVFRAMLLPGAAVDLGRSDVNWGQMLGRYAPTSLKTAETVSAVLAPCVGEVPGATCVPWRMGALVSMVSDIPDDRLRESVALATLRAGARWDDNGNHLRAALLALRLAQRIPNADSGARVALAFLRGQPIAPLSVRNCLSPSIEVVRTQCEDPRVVATAMVVGRCTPEVMTVARNGLQPARVAQRTSGACLMLRCRGAAELSAEVERAHPGDGLNRAVLALVPRWCHAGDGGSAR